MLHCLHARNRAPRALHPFPTRRSSDLVAFNGELDRLAQVPSVHVEDLVQGCLDDIAVVPRRKVRRLRPHIDESTVVIAVRSEEHTLNSSHLVISYAVCCLKKKRRKTSS